MKFAEIAVALPVDGLYTYKIPSNLSIEIGHTVMVPFGRQKVTGYVVGLLNETELTRVKNISRLLDPVPAFDQSILPFFKWIAKYYLSGLGEVISTALPKDYKIKSIRIYVPTETGIDALANQDITVPAQATLLREMIARSGRTEKSFVKFFHEELEPNVVRKALGSLVRSGWARIEEKEHGGVKGHVKTVELAMPKEKVSLRGARMQAAFNQLIDAGGMMDVADLQAIEGPTIVSALKRLEKKGIVRFGKREDRSKAQVDTLPASGEKHPPNDQQARALEDICHKPPQTHLLHGVTGAGKTEVYLQAAEHFKKQKKQTLILVPEIALTPLLIGRVKARFGSSVAALHSGLRQSERLREWRRIRAGEVDVAVGARSALFAPFQNLGLIVVDEEHDDSYKQGDGVRYHARDLAVVRGAFEKCPVVLGSATPSIESWNNANEEKYNLIRINKRATPKPVPEINLIDMRGRPPIQIISPELQTALHECFESGGKAIVLFNRRGYAPTVECPGCGGNYKCPSCQISLVYHRKSHKLSCHYCHFHRNFQQNCPQCGTPFDVMGFGTERVEEELTSIFPERNILRMDADTVATKGAHHRILDQFRSPDSHLLIGTQLVAKGHDFPKVTLAAVVGVDHILTMPDFRSAERTYALVKQLAGRAGRGSEAGKVIVQTRHPEHFIFRLLGNTDLPDPSHVFYMQEVRQRKILKYPPNTRLVLLRIDGEDRAKVREQANQLAKTLRSRRISGIDILGPTLAPMSKLIGRWRFQMILRGQAISTFRSWLEQNRDLLRSSLKGGCRLSIDVDPRNLL
ncbi:MAG: primosomal protein N' [Myxococcota bacterium]|nr:primosomal protein N' [Myxococcota bacterium]